MGGAVCYRDDDESRRSIASKDGCGDSEWVEQILGSRHRKLARSRSSDDREKDEKKNGKKDEKPTLAYAGGPVQVADGPRPAAVIPLPAPLWSGLAGLGALAFASGLRRLRRLL